MVGNVYRAEAPRAALTVSAHDSPRRPAQNSLAAGCENQ